MDKRTMLIGGGVLLVCILLYSLITNYVLPQHNATVASQPIHTYDVRFLAEKSELFDHSTGILADALAEIQKHGYVVSLFGRTSVRALPDSVGGKEKLSEDRAKAVSDWLVKNGVPAGVISVRALGATKPLPRKPHETDRDWNARNDSVIIELWPSAKK